MSNAADVIERIEASEAGRRQAASAGWWEMCRRVARGEEVDPDEVVACVAAAGRTHEEFVGDCEAVERRYAWKEKLDALPEMQKQADEMEKEINARFDALEEVKEAYKRDVVEGVYPRLRALREQITDTNSLTGRLIREYPYPDLAEREAEIATRTLWLQARIREKADVVRGLRAVAAAPEHGDGRGGRGVSPEKRAEAEGYLGLREQELAEMRDEASALRAELEAIERRKMEP